MFGDGHGVFLWFVVYGLPMLCCCEQLFCSGNCTVARGKGWIVSQTGIRVSSVHGGLGRLSGVRRRRVRTIMRTRRDDCVHLWRTAEEHAAEKKHECKVKQTRFFPPFILFSKFSFTYTVWRQNSRQASCLSGIWKINRGIDLLLKVKSNYVAFRDERPALQFPLQLYTSLENEFSPTFSFLFFLQFCSLGKEEGEEDVDLGDDEISPPPFNFHTIIFLSSPEQYEKKRKRLHLLYSSKTVNEEGKKRPPWCFQVAESYKKIFGKRNYLNEGIFSSDDAWRWRDSNWRYPLQTSDLNLVLAGKQMAQDLGNVYSQTWAL